RGAWGLRRGRRGARAPSAPAGRRRLPGRLVSRARGVRAADARVPRSWHAHAHCAAARAGPAAVRHRNRRRRAPRQRPAGEPGRHPADAARSRRLRILMRRSGRPARLVLPVLLLGSPPAFSDAGMWTFHDFPQDLVKRQYGADVSSAWLDRVRTATIRLSNCTASFVSPDGLILTNHHCAQACLDEHSSSERNLLRGGFLARSREQELKCGTQIADVLMSVENVTERVAAAIRGLDDRAANDTRKKTLTQLEQACEQESQHAKSGSLKCESVDLYQGGQYWLYKRSEEHTSELQSLAYLVCRLLLEKKNKKRLKLTTDVIIKSEETL